MWQGVDDGIGHMLKSEIGEYLDEKLESDEFYDEWTSGVMSASRVRVLTTEMVGEAWERVQKRLDASRIFRNKGWAMTVGDDNDNLKIHGLPDYPREFAVLFRKVFALPPCCRLVLLFIVLAFVSWFEIEHENNSVFAFL